MARRLALALVLIATACASGEVDDDGADNPSFGGGGSNPAASQPPATDVVTGGASEVDSASTTRPIFTTGGAPGDTGVDSQPDTTTGPDPDTAPDDATTDPVVLCGNAVIDAPEECDGADLNGQSCATLGFSAGTLACTPACVFDKSMCTSPSCGDATVDPGEECDCGDQGASCTGPQLGNQACGSLQSPKGTPYAGGALACNSPTSCSFNKSACTYCGDGTRNGGEVCDGADLGGQTCAGLGFTGGGTLTCSGDCSYNTAGCQNIVCGNGQCQPGEDSCSCPTDCPDDPNLCSPCECGGFSLNCACDGQCLFFGDCCANGPC